MAKALEGVSGNTQGTVIGAWKWSQWELAGAELIATRDGEKPTSSSLLPMLFSLPQIHRRLKALRLSSLALLITWSSFQGLSRRTGAEEWETFDQRVRPVM